MNRLFLRITAILLVPMLLTNPAKASASSILGVNVEANRIKDSGFTEQAFSNRLTSSETLYAGPPRATSRVESVRLVKKVNRKRASGQTFWFGRHLRIAVSIVMIYVFVALMPRPLGAQAPA